MTAPRFTDTTLNAWLDGELPPDQRADVEAWLRENPEDAARVRLWAADGEALRSRLDSVVAEAVPQRLTQLVLNAVPVSGGGWAAIWGGAGLWRWAAALALFVLGGVTGAGLMWRLQPAPAGSTAATSASAPTAWVQRAVLAHSVYVPEGRHAVEVKAQEEHLSRWLTRRLDVPVKLFDLRAQGFELVGGRLLPDGARPGAQLMYQAIAAPTVGDAHAPGGVQGVAGAAAAGSAGVAGGAGGTGNAAAAATKPLRVTVYLRKPDSNTPAEFRYEQQGELGMFYWVEGQSAHGGPTGYALVGALPRERLLALAEAIYRQGMGNAP
jgi:anti-sigma factor RsiW